MIGVMIFLFTVIFAILGRGDYQPPKPEEHSSVYSVI